MDQNFRREVLDARYYNCSGVAIAIVGVVNYHNGELFDRAAYIGAISDARRTGTAIRYAMEHGCKLASGDAAHYFPNLPVGLYWS